MADEPGAVSIGGRRLDARRIALLVALVVVGAWAAGTFVAGALAQVSFEPTEASNFQAWASRPLVDAGQGALGACLIGVIAWFLARRRPKLIWVACVAAVAAAGALVWGGRAKAARAHPEGARGRALVTLVLPSGYADHGIALEHPDIVTAPAATRTWTTSSGATACADLETALAGWVDRRSLRPGVNTPGRCYFSALFHHHAVDANVVPTGSQATISVRLAG